MPKLPTRLERAIRYVNQQREWVDQCGGDLLGYVIRYGSKDDPNHSGDGGEAIYAADKAELDRLESDLRALLKVKI